MRLCCWIRLSSMKIKCIGLVYFNFTFKLVTHTVRSDFSFISLLFISLQLINFSFDFQPAPDFFNLLDFIGLFLTVLSTRTWFMSFLLLISMFNCYSINLVHSTSLHAKMGRSSSFPKVCFLVRLNLSKLR